MKSRAIWGTTVVLTVGILSTVAESTARADLMVGDPFGNESSLGFVNRDPTDGTHWINWQNKATGACTFTFLGNGGFSDNIHVSLLGGDDTLIIVTASGGFNFCGFPMVGPNSNGRAISIIGFAGNDVISSATHFGAYIGNDGNDVLLSDRDGVALEGSAGDDTIQDSGFITGGTGAFSGSGGNDCMRINPFIPGFQQMSCGSGTDSWSGPGTKPADCETFSTSCCPMVFCD
jgi:hypothetical protein